MIQAVALCEQAGTAVLRGFDLDEDSDESIAEQAPPTNRPAAHQPYSSTARPNPNPPTLALPAAWRAVGVGRARHRPLSRVGRRRRRQGGGTPTPTCRRLYPMPVVHTHLQVTRAEFHRAMGLLRFFAPKAEIDVVFSSWDPDGSGVLELKELERLLVLRKGSTVLDAAGEAEARARAREGAATQAAAQAEATKAARVARATAEPKDSEGDGLWESTPRASSIALPPPPPPRPAAPRLAPRSPRQRHIEAVYTQLEHARRQDTRLAHLIVPHTPPAWAWKTERQAEARPVLATVRPSTVQAGQSPECPTIAAATAVATATVTTTTAAAAAAPPGGGNQRLGTAPAASMSPRRRQGGGAQGGATPPWAQWHATAACPAPWIVASDGRARARSAQQWQQWRVSGGSSSGAPLDLSGAAEGSEAHTRAGEASAAQAAVRAEAAEAVPVAADSGDSGDKGATDEVATTTPAAAAVAAAAAPGLSLRPGELGGRLRPHSATLTEPNDPLAVVLPTSRRADALQLAATPCMCMCMCMLACNRTYPACNPMYSRPRSARSLYEPRPRAYSRFTTTGSFLREVVPTWRELSPQGGSRQPQATRKLAPPAQAAHALVDGPPWLPAHACNAAKRSLPTAAAAVAPAAHGERPGTAPAPTISMARAAADGDGPFSEARRPERPSTGAARRPPSYHTSTQPVHRLGFKAVPLLGSPRTGSACPRQRPTTAPPVSSRVGWFPSGVGGSYELTEKQ